MTAAFEPFFLSVAPGHRFALFHPAANARGSVLFVHPFAEEMNKSRRAVAVGARALAAAGFQVLQIDLYGCGESSGDFAEATWERWCADLDAAANWLRGRTQVPMHVWGLRLGALLALDFTRNTSIPVESLIAWQPTLSGESFLTQFLRLELANEALRNGAAGADTRQLRERLACGAAQEIAGYTLNPVLAAAIEGIRAIDLVPAAPRVFWFDVRRQSEGGVPPAAQRVIDSWRNAGIAVEYECVAGEPFWTTQEIVEAPTLVEATVRALANRIAVS
jgi:exosortase A-associated hydrolase 2